MMMKNFKCESCGKEWEELYKNDEVVPETVPCESCGNPMIPWNFKNNDHCVHIMDPLK